MPANLHGIVEQAHRVVGTLPQSGGGLIGSRRVRLGGRGTSWAGEVNAQPASLTFERHRVPARGH